MKNLNLKNNDFWDRVRKDLKLELGLDIFKNWIEVLVFTDIEDNTAYFNVPSSFIANWVERNYGDKIIEAFNNKGILIKKLSFDYNNNDFPLASKVDKTDTVNYTKNSKVKHYKEKNNIEVLVKNKIL